MSSSLQVRQDGGACQGGQGDRNGDRVERGGHLRPVLEQVPHSLSDCILVLIIHLSGST